MPTLVIPPLPVEEMVIVSVVALAVKLTLAPAAKVKVPEALSASTLVLPTWAYLKEGPKLDKSTAVPELTICPYESIVIG